MKRALTALSVVAVAGLLSACSGVGGYTQPGGLTPTAGIYMETTSGGILHDNGVVPIKTGKACGTGIMGIVARRYNR